MSHNHDHTPAIVLLTGLTVALCLLWAALASR